MQKDELSWQVPFEQSLEQHSPLSAQALPEVLHVVLSAAQVPFVHWPPQQSALVAQVPLSETQAVDPHTPFTQFKLQQSVPAEQLPPGEMQLPSVVVQVFVDVSQAFEQQDAPVVHDCPVPLQVP
jgi:hypothetical protein